MAEAAGAIHFASCLSMTPQATLLARWRPLGAADWLDDANRLAAEAGLQSAGGAPIRFEPVARAPAAVDYERRILDAGVVACRAGEPGEWHDRLNAAVWLTLPRTKAALNRLHGQDDGAGADRAANRRTRRRDLATLVDESGLAWVSADAVCDDWLRTRAWRTLFVAHRDRVATGVLPVVVGHGLLAKLAQPYKALTAQVLVVPRGGDDRDVDRRVATTLAAAAVAVTAEAWPLVPLPVLALPGWCVPPPDADFFDDPTVFRPLPAAARGRVLARTARR